MSLKYRYEVMQMKLKEIWEKNKNQIVFYALCVWTVLGIAIPLIVIAVNVSALTSGFNVVLFSLMIGSGLYCAILVILRVIDMFKEKKQNKSTK